MKDINSIRQHFRFLLTDELGDAVIQLKELLLEGSAKHQLVLLQEGNFKNLNKQKLRGTINFETYQIESNKIRSALLDLIEELEAGDLEAPEKPTNKGTYTKGNILYDISSKMKVGTTHKCVIRIAFDEDTLLENIELSEDTKLQDIRISNVMLVDIVNPIADEAAFSIYTISEKEQFIDQDSYTQWVYYVKPLRTGQHPLILKVAIVEMVNNKERKREIVMEEMITILSEQERLPTEATQFKSAGYSFLVGAAEERAKRAAVPSPPTPSSGQSGSFFYKVVSVSMIALVLTVAGAWAIVPAVKHYNFWQDTIESDSVEAYEAYLDRYPDGKHAIKATARIEILEKEEIENTVPEEIPLDTIPSQELLQVPEEQDKKLPTNKQEKPVDPQKKKEETTKTEVLVQDNKTKQEQENEPPAEKAKEETPVKKAPTSMQDPRDNKSYRVIKVGNLLWMADNLEYKAKSTFLYDKDLKNYKPYGRLYRWDEAYYACPEGWRIPTDKEWRALAKAYGGCDEDASDGGRQAFQALFMGGASGFNAKAGGERNPDGKYNHLNVIGNYWSITPYATSNAHYYYFDAKAKRMVRSQAYKKFAYSCRCVKEWK